MTEAGRAAEFIAAIDRTLAARNSLNAARQIFLRAECSYKAAADEFAQAAADLRRATEIFEGQRL